ncbi:hypothetical protein LH47_02851 [Anoxybacillus thermarum]|uniref:ScoMcrA-like N-terminal head domain-containing protein n=2 Tax=Anoxybacillus thermarum TaxID=404937 RepID=A0A0D0QUB0_9BACL|nr:hypothetical protein LH47_02851 [Anoxybacillus thermarum]
MIPDNIKKDHVFMAIKEIDENGIPASRNSTKFQLFYNNKLYPPKYVLSLANKYANGKELQPWEFSGGVETNNFLEKLGFKIVSKAPSQIKTGPEKDNKDCHVARSKGGIKNKHNHRCSECKNTIIDMFRVIFGNVKIEHKMEIKARLEDYIHDSYYKDLATIYNALKNYRGNESFVRSKFLKSCDLYIPQPGFVVELDESQHFSEARKISLTHYPKGLKTGFNVNKWIEQCEKIMSKDNNPHDRDEQRAWYDTLRDFLPLIKGLQPTVRISLLDYTWCELDPNKEEDVELFKSLVLNIDTEKKENNKSSEKVRIATACLQSDGHYTNESRTRLLFELIDKLDQKADLILLPAGFYQTSNDPKTLYARLNKVIVQYLEKLNSNMAICLGIDGRCGLDQMAVLFTRNGLQAIGRKFYPTDFEEIDGADSYLSLEDSYSRVFELKGKKFYMAVCYDVFGIKKERLKNPGIDVILDLVHQFHPIGEDNSGDVLFAKHGFAGASKHWGCPIFGAAVFFNREIPKNWPTGVIWDCNKKNTRNWRYTDNPLTHYEEILIRGDENVLIRLFEI